tara:strand:- start:404 stop:784 length:381 start_codon:yes stop_codon:yes gene_type:complete
MEQFTPKASHRTLEENRLEDYPKVGDLVRVYKTNNEKAVNGCLGVIVGEVGVKTMELQIVFEPKFPVTVRDGILKAEGRFTEYINNSDISQYKDNSTYSPTIKTLVNFSKYSEELIIVKQLYTAIN